MNCALSTGIRFDAVEPSQQCVWIEFGFDDDDHVQVRTLIERSPHGVCLEDFGLSHNRVTETFDGELEVFDAISEVRPESNDCFVSGQTKRRSLDSMNANRGRIHVDWNRRPNLGECQIDRMNPRKFENDIRHPLSQALEKEITVVSGNCNQALTDFSIIHGLGEVVGQTGIMQIDMNVDIDA